MQNFSKKINDEKGAAMLIAIVFFLFITTTVVLGIVNPILKQVRISQDMIKSKESYYLAEGAMEDALYRIKNGKNILSGDTVVVNGYTSTVTLTSTSNGRTISITSNRNGIVRKLEANVIAGVGSAFNYGIQTGTGGFQLSGGARINGNVYSNGDILATNGVVITGSAVAANSFALTADQSNETPAVPTNNINFRDTSTNPDLAQSFQVNTKGQVNKISLYIKKVGAPADAVFRIVADSAGSPSTTDLLTTQGTLSAALVGTSNFGWVDVVLPSNPELTPGVTYWFVIDSSSQSSTNYYVIGGNNTYANGQAKIGKFSGTWNATSPSGLDSYFKIYLGGLTSTIGGDSYSGGVLVGSGGIGDAWAHTVRGATVSGNLYCQTGSVNNKACNTSKSDPQPQGYPISDANINDWKSGASGGTTITGDYTVGSSGATIGPVVITGNLVVNGGGTLTVNGTIWVKGNVTVSGGGKIKLAATYGSNSGVIVTDGIVNLGGGGSMSGSGQSTSWLMILTTSDCPASPSCAGSNALTLSGGAGAVVLNAQNGTMLLNGGAQVKEATAKTMIANGGAVITYDSGLSNVSFSSGPSGGWDISSWNEVQ